ncbi:ThiF family adenylyltransferase [Catenulispora pinisilvae]|uniref:ThiF family adenylyltransferase n=1 Tax=Catenulispora pinisilvae TaxID=2705253 RepID=UPI0018920E73|nr:ThiF family adenylyltransferase [Catenulispora pinisilvae]
MIRPRIKPGHAPQSRANGALWFGPWVHGMATELNDSSGVLAALCARLDGSRTREELVDDVVAAVGAQADRHDVAEVLDFLIGSGWILDADAPIPPELTPRDLDRYRRGIEYLETVNLRPGTDGYRMQARLKASCVTVLGVGGVGSAVAANLAASGIGRLRCVDQDVVELSNLSRQLLYTEADIGRPKVEVAARRLRAANSDIEVTAVNLALDGPETIAKAVAGSDAFVLCADQPRGTIRMWANDAAYRTGIPFLNAGYTGPEFTMSTFIPGTTPCASCHLAQVHEQARALGLRVEELDAGDNRVIASSAQISGHYLALETIHLLTGLPVQTAGRQLQRYLIDYDQHRYTDAVARPDCPVGCGDLIRG